MLLILVPKHDDRRGRTDIVRKPFCLPSWLFALFTACLVVLAAGCGGGKTSDSISITISNQMIAVGGTAQLTATDTNSVTGPSNVTNSVTWTSSDPSVATVTAAGLLKGVGAGSATVSAASKKATGSLSVSINAAAVTALTVSPQSAALFTGGQQQFSASATYSNGTAGDVTGQVAWSVTPATVATINASGLLQTVSAGSFTVTATSGKVTGTAAGSVTDPVLASIGITPASTNIASGASLQFTATGSYNDGSTKDVTSAVTWISSNTSVLSITAAGLATAASVTTATVATITAQLGALSASAAVNVTPVATMTALQVRPTSSSIAAGTAEQHTATAYYSDGTQQDVTSQASWSTAAASPSGGAARKPQLAAATVAPRPSDGGTGGVISVNQSGIDYAEQPGAANVEASFGSMQSQSVVLVTNATIQAMAISCSDLLIPVAATQQCNLGGWFSDGSAQDLSLTANWVSSDTSIATIDSSGKVTGVKAGRITLTASFGGLTTTKILQILSAQLVATTIRVPAPAVVQSVSENASVIGTFSDGTLQDFPSR